MSCQGTYSFQRHGKIKIGDQMVEMIKDVDIKVGGEREREEIIWAGLETACGSDGVNPELEITLSINLYDKKGLEGFFKQWLRNTPSTMSQTIVLWPGDGTMLTLDADNEFGMELTDKNMKPTSGKNRPKTEGSMNWKGYFQVEPEWVEDPGSTP